MESFCCRPFSLRVQMVVISRPGKAHIIGITICQGYPKYPLIHLFCGMCSGVSSVGILGLCCISLVQ